MDFNISPEEKSECYTEMTDSGLSAPKDEPGPDIISAGTCPGLMLTESIAGLVRILIGPTDRISFVQSIIVNPVIRTAVVNRFISLFLIGTSKLENT